MAVRKEVEEFLAFCSPMPSEEHGSDFEIYECGRLLHLIERPVSDEEAHALAAAFGHDMCFGLAWTLLHLIETAPGAMTAVYSNESSSFWVDMLNERVAFAREMGYS